LHTKINQLGCVAWAVGRAGRFRLVQRQNISLGVAGHRRRRRAELAAVCQNKGRDRAPLFIDAARKREVA